MIETVLIAILFIANLAFLYLWQLQREKAEEKRFREFVIASKSKDIDQYNNSIPESGELPQPNSDEIIELSEGDPAQVLKAIKEEHANN